MFPIQSTIKESNTSRGNEARVTFTNELVIILPLLYVEDNDAPDPKRIQEIYNVVEDGNLEDLLPRIQPETDILTIENHNEEAASVLDINTDRPRNRVTRR